MVTSPSTKVKEKRTRGLAHVNFNRKLYDQNHYKSMLQAAQKNQIPRKYFESNLHYLSSNLQFRKQDRSMKPIFQAYFQVRSYCLYLNSTKIQFQLFLLRIYTDTCMLPHALSLSNKRPMKLRQGKEKNVNYSFSLHIELKHPTLIL